MVLRGFSVDMETSLKVGKIGVRVRDKGLPNSCLSLLARKHMFSGIYPSRCLLISQDSDSLACLSLSVEEVGGGRVSLYFGSFSL